MDGTESYEPIGAPIKAWTPEIETLMHKQIVDDDWIGYVTVHLELWERGPVKPQMRGQSVVSGRFLTVIETIANSWI